MQPDYRVPAVEQVAYSPVLSRLGLAAAVGMAFSVLLPWWRKQGLSTVSMALDAPPGTRPTVSQSWQSMPGAGFQSAPFLLGLTILLAIVWLRYQRHPHAGTRQPWASRWPSRILLVVALASLIGLSTVCVWAVFRQSTFPYPYRNYHVGSGLYLLTASSLLALGCLLRLLTPGKKAP